MTVIFSDLHLREQSADVCFRVLEWIGDKALAGDRHVVCCGDFFHVRYQVSVRLLNRVHGVLTEWGTKGIALDIVPGNHDQVDVGGSNALEVFEAHGNVRVWTEPGILEGYRFGFIPYRKDPDLLAEAIAAVEEHDPNIVFAHFGVQGAVMNSGRVNREEGLELSSADKSTRYVLGHYHKRQSGGSWQYVGSPYQTNFGEAGNSNGCLVLKDGDLSFQEIDVGAPKHFVVEWDPSTSDSPPPSPGSPGDNVRLDIKATQDMIVKGKFRSVLKASGLGDAQVKVIPVAVDREIKLELEQGESLVHAAERFAVERLGAEESREPMAALRRWSGAV